MHLKDEESLWYLVGREADSPREPSASKLFKAFQSWMTYALLVM